MPDLSWLAVVVATGTGFFLGFAYYMLTGSWLADLGTSAIERPSWQVPVVEIARNFVVAVVLAGIAGQMEIDFWGDGALLGLALWVAFPVVLWTGAIFHEGTDPRVALIHAGDWLVKLLAMGVIVGTLQ